ncbi:MAG: hypothetical protein ACI4QG_07555 [Candidatus Cryptobacteroides sp.]
MKYLIRSVKYFIYLVVIISLILAILVLIGAAEADISTMFRNGYNALWQIAILFAVIAAIYPKFGFITRDAIMTGTLVENTDRVRNYMASREYVLESENGNVLTYRHRGFISRLTRMFEDRITITLLEGGGATVEGLRKDAFRIAAGIENRPVDVSEE